MKWAGKGESHILRNSKKQIQFNKQYLKTQKIHFHAQRTTHHY